MTIDFDTPNTIPQPQLQDFSIHLERHSGESIDARVTQIGQDEVRLQLDSELSMGEVVLLVAETKIKETLWQSPGEVHWHQRESGIDEVGLFLTHRLPDEFVAWKGWERRLQLRYPIHQPARLWWDGRNHGVPVTVTNYSTNGLGLIASEHGRIGESFILTTSGTNSPVAVAGTCCWQSAQHDGYVIGCELKSSQGRRFAGLTNLASAR